MKNPINILIVYLFILFPLSCSGKSKGIEEKVIQEEKEDPQLVLYRQLKNKADSALLFCKEKGLNTDICLLVDMKIHSGKKRFFLWDFKNDSILASSLCAHGYGMESTEDKPVFSNIPGSYTSSLGKYKIGIRSYSKWGINVHYKMHGLEKTNNNAYERIIVLHSHNPIPTHEIHPYHLPLGYSQGCPVIDNETMKLLDTKFKKIEKQALLWIYD